MIRQTFKNGYSLFADQSYMTFLETKPGDQESCCLTGTFSVNSIFQQAGPSLSENLRGRNSGKSHLARLEKISFPWLLRSATCPFQLFIKTGQIYE
jgi:hypothetical protein